LFADTFLKSVGYVIKDLSADECIGYALESPTGTFPALAINGPVTPEDLHDLIDRLIPAATL